MASAGSTRLTYTKPTFMPLAVPDESGVANKYYVDMSNGLWLRPARSPRRCASIAAVSANRHAAEARVHLHEGQWLPEHHRQHIGRFNGKEKSSLESLAEAIPAPAVMTAQGGCQRVERQHDRRLRYPSRHFRWRREHALSLRRQRLHLRREWLFGRGKE